MRFFVTGASGLVGMQIVRDLRNANVFSAYHYEKPFWGITVPIDLVNEQSITKTLTKINPDVIIHVAAMTGVDECELQQDLATQINSKSTEIISKLAKKNDAFLIYMSTDYVFDGKKGMYKETDLPNPIGFYGKSKLEGEKSVISNASRYCITRISTPFGIHPTKQSFPIWVYKNLKEKKQINVITDQFTTPTYIQNLSKMIIEIITKQIQGILHVSGATRISRFDMANLVADKLCLDKNLIIPVTTNKLDWIAKRPSDSSLDTTKAQTILEQKPLQLETTLNSFSKEIMNQ